MVGLDENVDSLNKLHVSAENSILLYIIEHTDWLHKLWQNYYLYHHKHSSQLLIKDDHFSPYCSSVLMLRNLIQIKCFYSPS